MLIDGSCFEGCDPCPGGGGFFNFINFFQLIPEPVDGFWFEGCDDADPGCGLPFKLTNFLNCFFQLNLEPVDDAGLGDGEFTTFVQAKSESVDGFGSKVFDNAGLGDGGFTTFVQ